MHRSCGSSSVSGFGGWCLTQQEHTRIHDLPVIVLPQRPPTLFRLLFCGRSCPPELFTTYDGAVVMMMLCVRRNYIIVFRR